MRHEQVRELVDAYVDKELDLVTALECERHLDGCDDCRIIFEQYRELQASVKAQFPRFDAPDQLAEKIRAQLRSGTDTQHRSVRREWIPRWRMWSLAAGIAAIVLFGVFLLRTVRGPAASNVLAEQVVSSHIRSLMANHLTDVPSTDQHTVKPWFSGKLDFAPTVKDLSSKGFSLIGGRLDYLNDRSVAALVYKRRQHTINVFIWPTSDSDSRPRTRTVKGFNVVQWTKSHMVYWAVSDLNAVELAEFASDLNS